MNALQQLQIASLARVVRTALSAKIHLHWNHQLIALAHPPSTFQLHANNARQQSHTVKPAVVQQFVLIVWIPSSSNLLLHVPVIQLAIWILQQINAHFVLILLIIAILAIARAARLAILDLHWVMDLAYALLDIMRIVVLMRVNLAAQLYPIARLALLPANAQPAQLGIRLTLLPSRVMLSLAK